MTQNNFSPQQLHLDTDDESRKNQLGMVTPSRVPVGTLLVDYYLQQQQQQQQQQAAVLVVVGRRRRRSTAQYQLVVLVLASSSSSSRSLCSFTLLATVVLVKVLFGNHHQNVRYHDPQTTTNWQQNESACGRRAPNYPIEKLHSLHSLVTSKCCCLCKSRKISSLAK